MIKVNLYSLYPSQKVLGMDISYIYKLSEKIKNGEEISPPIIYYLDGKYHIIDGHHRVLAYLNQKIAEIDCIEIDGNKNEYGLSVDDVMNITQSDLYDWEDIIKELSK